ncbi:MAG: rare lipoprotein [Bacteroidetes bacterium]|nr:rare lipoprotein [Bacteroidota bacterium]
MQRIAVTTVIFSLLLCAATATAQEVGMASFYHDYFNGKRTASGELYDSKKLTAAHKTLPIGTMIKVTNLANARSVIVRVNDRGPYVQGRILDLSRAGAEQLGYIPAGSAKVSYEVINTPVIEIKDTTRITPIIVEPMYVITEVDTTIKMLYGVKLGSFDDPKVAFTLSKDLKSKYKTVAYVQNVKMAKGNFYRIYVGNFATQEEADKLQVVMKKLYPECRVVKYEGMK